MLHLRPTLSNNQIHLSTIELYFWRHMLFSSMGRPISPESSCGVRISTRTMVGNFPKPFCSPRYNHPKFPFDFTSCDSSCICSLGSGGLNHWRPRPLLKAWFSLCFSWMGASRNLHHGWYFAPSAPVSVILRLRANLLVSRMIWTDC